MLLLEKLNHPSLLVEKEGQIKLLTGELHSLPGFDDLIALGQDHQSEIVFVIPFCAASENGMTTQGDEPLLAIRVNQSRIIDKKEITEALQENEINFKTTFEPQISDAAFAAEVTRIQEEEITQGNACQVIYSRKFVAQLEELSPAVPLQLFNSLLDQPGQYLTFLFSDGKGGYFVGASPERQLEIHDELVIKNPISGTMPKGDREGFPQRLDDFLKDQKEINELSQILDEELKIMSQICPRGGKITGPFLREAGSVIHTEYHLAGHSKKPAITALKISLHAPTLVGSPLESAFRIIAKRETESRRYYGGEIGILEPNGNMYSAIMIRTAEIFPDGRIAIQAGAGIVRDSKPLKEAAETSAKAAGLISALTGPSSSTERYLSTQLVEELNDRLTSRNDRFSRFHFEDQIGHRDLSNLHQESITIINNEDNFAKVLGHITTYLGYVTTVVDTFDYDVINDASDLVVLGPGPGDINDETNPRMERLLEITDILASKNTPTLGICLGIQAMAKQLGMPVQRQSIPTQGVQVEIDLFGKPERVGMYNSFSPVAENIPPGFEVSIHADNRIMALRSENIYGFQFHVESAMTENGLDILSEALDKLMGIRERRRLSFEAFVEKSVSGKLNIEAQKEFLLDLNQHGFSGEDIADLVKVFYEKMPRELDLPGAIDLCGTGGSGLARINTSTMAAFLVAAAGIPVAKHGNKAASGRFGSFDLLEAMGINIMAEKPQLEAIYGELNLAFIFARSFHPVFKHFAQVRGELKAKTIFNLLGPLLNPARPEYQIIGTSNQEDMELLIKAARALGKTKVMVMNGADGLDELTLTGETTIMTLENGVITRAVLTPKDFGLKQVDFSEIAGGSEAFNVQITHDILEGRCNTAHRDLVYANAALAFKFMGLVESYPAGMDKARELVEQGQVSQLIHRYRQLSVAPDILMEIVSSKREELKRLKEKLPLEQFKKDLKPSDRSFKAALGSRNELALIAEIKRSSPSEKQLFKGAFSPALIARQYESSGADAISVLTDKEYFQGDLEFLRQARRATQSTPLLMKDFFIDEYQIYLARHYGADAILLIAAILADAQIEDFTRQAQALDMDVLLEIHNQEELARALRSEVAIIGINNRDLHTFTIDTKTVMKLGKFIPQNKVLVAESGYTPSTTKSVQRFVNAVLVGSSLMKGDDLPGAVKQIKQTTKHFKACGIRTQEDAEFCEKVGVPFVGLNFVPTSKRVVSVEAAREIKTALDNSLSVGVFQDQSLEEVQRIVGEVGLDMVQLSGSEDVEFCSQIELPVIKTLRSTELDKLGAYSEVVSMFIIDGAIPGSGQGYDYSKLSDLKSNVPVLIAGGINELNAAEILALLPQAAGLDIASGIETNGLVDQQKIQNLVDQVTGVKA